MDQNQAIVDAVTALETRVAGVVSRVAAQNNIFQQAITDLQNHPAAPDLTDIIKRLTTASAALDSVDPAPAPAVAATGTDTVVAPTDPIAAVNTAPAQQPADTTTAAPADPAAPANPA